MRLFFQDHSRPRGSGQIGRRGDFELNITGAVLIHFNNIIAEFISFNSDVVGDLRRRDDLEAFQRHQFADENVGFANGEMLTRTAVRTRAESYQRAIGSFFKITMRVKAFRSSPQIWYPR